MRTAVATSIEDLREAIVEFSSVRLVGSGTGQGFALPGNSEQTELRIALSGVIEHDVSDQVVKVWAGTPVGELQSVLMGKGQCLPFLGFTPEESNLQDCKGTVGGRISLNLPHSYEADAGAWRDWVLGLTVVQADGTIAKCGSKAVKNVAGYDVQKLFIGARGTLAAIAEVILRVYPLKALPASDRVLGAGKPADSGVIQRTNLMDYPSALHEAGDLLVAANPKSATLYLNAGSPKHVQRFGGDWIIGWGFGKENLSFTDRTQVTLMQRAKAIFDPDSKFNTGQMGIF